MANRIKHYPKRLVRLFHAKGIKKAARYAKKEIEDVTAQETDHAKQLLDKKRRWYTIWSGEEDDQGWGPESERILSESYWM